MTDAVVTSASVPEAFIVDAHVHTGALNVSFAPETDAKSLLARMDRLGIRRSINLGSSRNLLEASQREMDAARAEFEESRGRLYYCGFFGPRRAAEDLAILERSHRAPGFVGIKIHPSFARVAADDPRYLPVWELAREHRLPIVSHTWSVSSYNPVQALSTPGRFEAMVQRFPEVRFVMGHSGGRGEGRLEALRMAGQYPNAYMDISGDMMDRHFLEQMVGAGVASKILFGSDYPWLDQRAHLACVLLAAIPVEAKADILQRNAQAVFGLA